MILSFGGVLCISFSGQDSPVDDQESTVATGSHFLGCVYVFITSWCYAGVTIITRKMQKVNFSVMLFYYSCIAFPVTMVIILGESWINAHGLRFWDYSGSQYGWMLLVSLLNFL
mmetsp:Transcript_83/g.114  ORF Transcript_83/g.114 Transcript_83/m.114 type:complete len:114 (-) Transcript_83:202-543(-)